MGEVCVMQTNDIRFAKPEEAQLLSKLALRSKGYWDYDLDFLANCKEELTYNERQLLSAEYCFKVLEKNHGNVIGFFALNFITDEYPELEALFVDPDYIGQGWGKYLLNAAKKVAKTQQHKTIKLQSDPFALDFYLANGAVKVGEIESFSIPGRFLPLLEICL